MVTCSAVTNEPLHVVETADAADYRADVERLRVAAYAADSLQVPDGFAWDAFDDQSLHVLALRGVELVAAARVFILNDGPWPDPGVFEVPGTPEARPVAVFGRLVVAPAERRRGLASEIDKRRTDIAAGRGATSCVVHVSKPSRIEQLLARGWRILGEPQTRMIENGHRHFVLCYDQPSGCIGGGTRQGVGPVPLLPAVRHRESRDHVG
jgi:hypothetical protein